MTEHDTAFELTLYGRANCHLCDEAEAVLGRLSTRVPLEIRRVDVDSDPTYAQRYGNRVPVITTADGEVLGEGRVSVVDLLASLRKSAQAR